ncbi:hypothetical protein Glove_40g26 [Diversispora epigaea]|uniref:Uncharacterized protein n=1 Tax=Diversispora epigaea TaxID=1348612 RepID=A0A397JRN4_9GLOM|nr:hypothetical protein Glove_40g26 [Diversispora epigaea]
MSCELSCNTHEKLFSIRNLLQEEAIMAQNNVKTWVKHLSVFVKESNTSNRDIMAQNNVKTWVKHLSVFVKESNTSNRECAIHHYTPQDEIDKGTICLFANKSDSKELFAALHNLEKKLCELLLSKKPLKSFLIFGINV